MRTTTTSDGLLLEGATGRVRLGPCRPALLVDLGPGPQWWRPEVVGGDAGRLVVGPGPGGLVVEVDLQPLADYRAERIDVAARVRNTGSAPLVVERLVVLESTDLQLGDDPARWRSWRNGFQSWSGTTGIGTDERDADMVGRLLRRGTNDPKHPSPTGRGHVRSDTLGAVADPRSGDTLAVAHLTTADAFAHVELDAPGGRLRRWSVWVDLDGTELAPGECTTDQRFALVVSTGPTGGWHALSAAADATGAAMDARVGDGHHPAGWCSWYYHFTRVRAADVTAALEVLAADGRDGPEFGCEYVMVDDGHQRAIGDWLDTNRKFPHGMAAVADEVRGAGFDAGLWWAPFLVDPRSTVARAHPEWLVRDDRGRAVTALFNPLWARTRGIKVLDTTHPEVLAHLEGVAATVAAWGFGVQKLDFLFAAAVPGRRHDPTATRARAVRAGLEAVRAGAGDDAFLLGCGCPLGPAVGVVDAMRIGADVAPYWSNVVDRALGRGRHGVATRNAVVNTVTRAVLDGRWWRNDPDCLMVREDRTRMDLEEVRTLATAVGLTDGMVVLSDRMDRLPAGRRAMVATVHGLTGGRPEVLDLFERARPELVVSRRDDGFDLGVLHLGDAPRRTTVDLRRPGLLDPTADAGLVGPLLHDETVLTELWTGEDVVVRGGIADLGTMPPHSARVLRVRRPPSPS